MPNSEKGTETNLCDFKLDTTKLNQILPGVIQLESKRASVGRTSPLSRAFFILSSASLADLDT